MRLISTYFRRKLKQSSFENRQFSTKISKLEAHSLFQNGQFSTNVDEIEAQSFSKISFCDDASKKSENGKSLENLKIENTRLLRRGRKNPTVLSYVSSYFCGLLAERKIRKSCFEASHMSAVMRSLSCGDSWLCLLCRLFQLCWSLVCGCNCRRR